MEMDSIRKAKLDEISKEMQRVEALANKHHLQLIRISPRRYIVAKRGTTVSRCKGGPEFAYWTAKQVYGPATEEDCVDYIKEVVES